MSAAERQQYLHRVTQWLVALTVGVLFVLLVGLYGFSKLYAHGPVPQAQTVSVSQSQTVNGATEQAAANPAPTEDNRSSYLIVLVFIAGLLGGFVSIQQRLPKISLEELKVLSSSWVSITLIPINGGIFALVLMLVFAGNILQGQFFPTYPDTFHIHDTTSFYYWLAHDFPVNGTDVAKLLFWSFAAGFSERLVPQIIRRTAAEAEDAAGGKPAKVPVAGEGEPSA